MYFIDSDKYFTHEKHVITLKKFAIYSLILASGYFSHDVIHGNLVFNANKDNSSFISKNTAEPADILHSSYLLQDKSDGLKNCLAELSEKNQQLIVANKNHGEAKPDNIKHIQPDRVLLEELVSLREYKQQIEMKKYADNIEAQRLANVNAMTVMRESFSNERIDENWAIPKKTWLDNLVAADHSLAYLANIASECRSMRCSLSFVSEDQKYQATLDDSLQRIISDRQLGLGSYTTVVDDSNHTVTIYFDRSEATQ